MRLRIVQDRGTTLRVEGVFDGLAARRVEVELVAAREGATIEIDLTAVREFHDFAIAVLGQALTRSRARVVLRGLALDRIRVLRLFGVDAGPLERAVRDAG